MPAKAPPSEALTPPIRVVICAQRQLGLRCAEYLAGREDTEIVAVVSQPGDWQADLLEWGVSRRIRAYAGNVNLYAAELAALRPDFLFSIVYTPILKSPILGLPEHGCVNLHPGLLPRYGGCHPVNWAILNGECHAGATLHYMDEQIDTGQIIAQAAVPISAETTARTLYDTVNDSAFFMFRETYDAIISGRAGACSQDASERGYYARNSLDFQRDRLVAFDKPVESIRRRANAFTFEPFQMPGVQFRLPDGQIREAEVEGVLVLRNGGPPEQEPGRAIGISDAGGLVVAAPDGVIELRRLDRLRAVDFLESMSLTISDVVLV